jgi:DNA-directed RNA polymerase specialized sigma24 family protein
MPPDDASLTRHLGTLYPLACVLVGPDTADTLLRHTYERAAATAPEDRPADTQGWLLQLLVDTHAQATGPTGPRPSHTDALRREVADDILSRMLPAAFATGSEEERLVLTLDVLDASPDTIGQALDAPPDAIEDKRTQAWSALRTRLLEGLSGPEHTLLAESISTEQLRTALRENVTSRFPSPPAALRSVLHAILQRAEAEDAAPPAAPSSPEKSPPADARAPTVPENNTRRRLVGGLLVLLLIAGATYAVLQFQSPGSTAPSAPDLPTLATAAADTLRPSYETSDPVAARSFVESTLERRVSVPSVSGAPLQGVGRLRVNDLRVPAFVYAEADGPESITILAFHYAGLDRLGDRVHLSDDLRNALAKNQELLPQPTDGQAAVLWRQRDDILVAVAPHLSPEALRDRITPAADSLR